eukprot:CAMPEP_0174827192 /NCGR_PEP_ID=MMETSP1114-20130205/543_1 /TAXON_ID=312471 /ORGANISM="Neobodo designis, Strain CCAP 1951/1" /LENGTH=192 /DNA_ID=CAMNT_0016060799 /DNA_START=31 /DNA_END=609 /DNA_ORIENTATION=+
MASSTLVVEWKLSNGTTLYVTLQGDVGTLADNESGIVAAVASAKVKIVSRSVTKPRSKREAIDEVPYRSQITFTLLNLHATDTAAVIDAVMQQHGYTAVCRGEHNHFLYYSDEAAYDGKRHLTAAGEVMDAIQDKVTDVQNTVLNFNFSLARTYLPQWRASVDSNALTTTDTLLEASVKAAEARILAADEEK